VTIFDTELLAALFNETILAKFNFATKPFKLSGRKNSIFCKAASIIPKELFSFSDLADYNIFESTVEFDEPTLVILCESMPGLTAALILLK
jgi:hypothetical protein